MRITHLHILNINIKHWKTKLYFILNRIRLLSNHINYNPHLSPFIIELTNSYCNWIIVVRSPIYLLLITRDLIQPITICCSKRPLGSSVTVRPNVWIAYRTWATKVYAYFFVGWVMLTHRNDNCVTNWDGLAAKSI